MSVDISKVDKVKLLKCLWSNSKPASFFKNFMFLAPEFNDEEAKEAVTKYIDYFCGRLIKTDLSENYARPDNYDGDYGAGSFEKCVKQCLETSK